MKKLLLILMIVVVAGCEPVPPPKHILEGGYQDSHPNNLPRSAKVVEDLGNGWIVFTCEIRGVERTFMYRNEGDYSGDQSWAEAAITELVPIND